jgi:hypothetical protein
VDEVPGRGHGKPLNIDDIDFMLLLKTMQGMAGYALPEVNPSLYFGRSLGVTFPLNILLGIPAYTALAQAVLL